MMRLIYLIFTIVLPLVARAEVIDRILAVVNDDIITQSDLVNYQKKMRSNGLLDESLLNMYDKKKLQTDNQALIQFLIDEKTIDTEITRQGLVTPIEQVESEIRNIARARGIDRNQLKQALAKEGVVYSEYQDFVKTSLQRQTLLQKEVTSKIKISDEEINAYYLSNNKSSKALVFEYTLAHILFLSSRDGSEAAEKRARIVREKLDKKIPFETLAAQYSEDPNFVQGGLFGTFRVSEFNKDVEQVISQLGVTDISPVIKMADGYRIFKVLKKTLVPSPDLEAKRENIRQLLLADNFKKQFRSWLEQRRRDSYIKIN